MIVYLAIFSGEGLDTETRGVFSTRKKAEKFIEKQERVPSSRWDIEEFVVDP